MPIKYEYGRLGEQIIHIDSVSPSDWHGEYICIGCGNPLTPALGNIRQHHFRHKVVTNCSPETYLHRLAKEKFYEIYKHCRENGIPFEISFSVVWNCNHFDWIPEALRCKKPHLETYDLTKYFPTIDLETGHGEFIPDILLRNSKGEVLYFEIKASHGCTRKKISSGNRIIEVRIDCEKDIEEFTNLKITESPKIKFFNFIRQERTGDFCKGKCKAGQLHRQATEPTPVRVSDGARYRIYRIGDKNVFASSYHEALSKVIQ